MIRGLQNVVAMRPSSQVMADLRESLLYGEWGEQALIAALEGMDQAELSAYATEFWRDARAEVMIYGNYDPEVVEEVSRLTSRVVSNQSVPELPDLKVLRLAAGESLQYEVDIPHDDSVVAWYLQGAGVTWEDRAATALTAQIMKTAFFQELRTEQQLGYIASAFAMPQLDVPGLVMLIQSPTASAVTVAKAMDDFMGEVEENLTEEQFQRHKQALISDILRPDKNLWDRAEFYWQSIARKQFSFDSRELLAETVGNISMESWIRYFGETFIAQRRSLQVVAPGRWEELPPGKAKRYQDAKEIKSGHAVYVIE